MIILLNNIIVDVSRLLKTKRIIKNLNIKQHSNQRKEMLGWWNLEKIQIEVSVLKLLKAYNKLKKLLRKTTLIHKVVLELTLFN